jgi:hypothetical protein
MRFFFPDSQDQIDPSFDFRTEERSLYRVRQRDDRYAHEVLKRPAYTGILVSKAIVDGTTEGAGKYSLPQRHRLYRLGVRRFFRLDETRGPRLETIGDCGAFSYVREESPPYSVDEVIDFYEGCGFDFGISVDHVILGYLDEASGSKPSVDEDWIIRQKLTLELARQFLRRHKARRCRFTPVGVAQGWDPASYARAVRKLQAMGYKRIALGGMVPLKTHQVLACLERIKEVRLRGTQLHLLGVTRSEYMTRFARLAVTSFDSTSPFRQAFKDDKDNYHTPSKTFTALRVPQVDANPRMKKLIQAGRVDQQEALLLEAEALEALQKFDRGRLGVQRAVAAVTRYESLFDEAKDQSEEYERTLTAAPWKTCACGICREIGIDIIIFRGSERNKRRGFHNLYAFNRRLQQELKPTRTARATNGRGSRTKTMTARGKHAKAL